MTPRGAGFARGLALCLGSALLGACAQPAAVIALPAPASVVPPATCDPQAAGTRWLLRFHQPVAGEAADVVQQLQAHSGVCVRHAAAVAPASHAYVFGHGLTPAQLRQRLLAWPLVQDAQPDERLRAH